MGYNQIMANGLYTLDKVKRNRFWLIAACVTGFFSVLLFVMLMLRNDAQIAEWWTKNIQASWVQVVGTINSVFPFSVFEVLVAILIAAALGLLIRGIGELARKRFVTVLKGVVVCGITALIIVTSFTYTMGFGYSRPAYAMKAVEGEIGQAQYVLVVERAIDDFNALSASLERDKNGNVFCPYTLSELTQKIGEAYDAINDDGYLSSYTPRLKMFALSPMLEAFFTGVTFLPTAEPNIVSTVPPSYRTVIAAHEIAHAKGVQGEGDANRAAYSALLASDDAYLRYCGYYETLSNVLSVVMLIDKNTKANDYTRLKNKIDPNYFVELSFEADYWLNINDWLSDISNFFNDLFLKSNGITDGTGDYGGGSNWNGSVDENPSTGEIEITITYSDVQKYYMYLLA